MTTDTPQMPTAEAHDEHRWLQQLAGKWTYKSEVSPEPGCDAEGNSEVRMLGDLWALVEAEGSAGGHPGKSIITLGFDPETRRFVGSFICTMMHSFWIYDGALDEGGKRLRLKSEGPRFDGQPGKALYEDAIEIVSPDEHLLRASVQQDDGTWQEFMVTRYRRAK